MTNLQRLCLQPALNLPWKHIPQARPQTQSWPRIHFFSHSFFHYSVLGPCPSKSHWSNGETGIRTPQNRAIGTEEECGIGVWLWEQSGRASQRM